VLGPVTGVTSAAPSLFCAAPGIVLADNTTRTPETTRTTTPRLSRALTA